MCRREIRLLKETRMSTCPNCHSQLTVDWRKASPPLYYRCSCGVRVKERFSAPWVIVAGLIGIAIGIYESSPYLPDGELMRFLILILGAGTAFSLVHWYCGLPVIATNSVEE